MLVPRAIIISMIFQRKFAREVPEAKSDTFKRFREWLHQKFALGCPTEEEWGQIVVDDNYQYHHPYVDLSYNGNSPIERGREYVDPEGDYGAGVENDVLDGYNPEMHAFVNGTE